MEGDFFNPRTPTYNTYVTATSKQARDKYKNIRIEVKKKYSWDDDLEWYMNDIACSTKTNVVCEKSFHYNEMDVDDLPKH